MPLLTTDDFESLPLDPIGRWLKLRDLVEERFDNAGQFSGENDVYPLLEYVEVLSSSAEALKIGVLPEISEGDVFRQFGMFRSKVAALATRISVTKIRTNESASIVLQPTTKLNIYEQIEKLRLNIIENTGLPDRQKRRSLEKLDELQGLIFSDRTDYAKLMKVLAYLGMTFVNSVVVLAEGPAAISTIAALIGLDQAAQEDVLQINKTNDPLQLPAPKSEAPSDQENPF